MVDALTWWLLLLLLPQATARSGKEDGDTLDVSRPFGSRDVTSFLNRPHIHYCRSPNMETFTCWWHLPDNSSQNDGQINYTLTYTVGKGPRQECPDYVTSGPNSCYFDSHHTQVWEVYCMSVTAQEGDSRLTSEEHCLDVADIVETDPPLNLTYHLGSCTEEPGCIVSLFWRYPITVDVQMGWVTLVYELQYRRESESHNWKVKGGLRETQLELLGLPVGRYVVRVRCKSRNARLWSKWSDSITVDIPPRKETAASDKMLAMILVMAAAMLAILIIGFGVIPHGKRLKAFLLPPVPKPRIRGIDSALLKNGKIEEISHMFSSFQGYTPAQYSEEVPLQVNVDEDLPLKGSVVVQPSKIEGEITSCTQGPGSSGGQALVQVVVEPAPYGQGPGSCIQASSHSQLESRSMHTVQMPSQAQPSPGTTQFLTFPALGYSTVLDPLLVQPTNQDFYTCVNQISTSGAVHLVPCLPDHPYQPSYLWLGGPADTVKKSPAESRSQLASRNGQSELGTSVGTASLGAASAGSGLDTYAALEDIRFHNELGVSTGSTQ